MSQFKKFNYILCTSCASRNWEVALGNDRIILDCAECSYRYSLPLDEAKLEDPKFKTMPLEFSIVKAID